MTTNICRAYKIVIEAQPTSKRGVLEVSELPSRSHLFVSFTNADLPSGVGLLLDRSICQALVKIFQELEFRLERLGNKEATRSITLPESDKRADDDSPLYADDIPI